MLSQQNLPATAETLVMSGNFTKGYGCCTRCRFFTPTLFVA